MNYSESLSTETYKKASYRYVSCDIPASEKQAARQRVADRDFAILLDTFGLYKFDGRRYSINKVELSFDQSQKGRLMSGDEYNRLTSKAGKAL